MPAHKAASSAAPMRHEAPTGPATAPAISTTTALASKNATQSRTRFPVGRTRRHMWSNLSFIVIPRAAPARTPNNKATPNIQGGWCEARKNSRKTNAIVMANSGNMNSRERDIDRPAISRNASKMHPVAPKTSSRCRRLRLKTIMCAPFTHQQQLENRIRKKRTLRLQAPNDGHACRIVKQVRSYGAVCG